VNAGEMRDMLVRQGAIFQTTSDTEVLVHLFARSREEALKRRSSKPSRRCAALSRS
jgi:amidophosphoribosyltransferase